MLLRAPTNQDAATADYRYELKYVMPARAEHTVRALVRAHSAAFSKAYPPRIVNSLYFDTGTWSNVESNLAGVSDRAKLRLRWYGRTSAPESSVLEHKQKRGGLGRKISWKLHQRVDLMGPSWRRILGHIAREGLGPLAPVLATNCYPVLFGRYVREYYVAGDGLVRLTVDTDLTAYDQTRFSRMNDRFPSPNLPLLVLELKAQADQYQRLAEIASGFPFRAVAFSKYLVGVLNGLPN